MPPISRGFQAAQRSASAPKRPDGGGFDAAPARSVSPPIPRADLEPDACGESGRRVEELDPPGQLSGDPKAGADSLAWREITGRWGVEAVASVDDLADESS